MAILAQVAPDRLEMASTASGSNANLRVQGEGDYLHGVSLADFAIVCGNLTGVSLWAPVQDECDLGTLASNIDQTMYMDKVYINSLEFGYTTGANATENYGAETDQKMWLLNDGRFINWEEFEYTTFSGGVETLASGVTIATFSDGSLGFLRTDDNGARGVTYFDESENSMKNWAVVSGTSSAAATFVYNAATNELHLPTGADFPTAASGDKIFALYAGDAYAPATTNKYFEALSTASGTYGNVGVGAVRQGQVEVYLVSATDTTLDNAWRLTGCTITSDLTREPLMELGHLAPYDRPLTLPVPITVTIDTTAGDLEHWSRFADRYPEYDADTMDEISLAHLMSSDQLKLVVKVFAQTDEEAGGTGANRTVATGSDLIGKTYFNDGTAATYAAAGAREYALKTIVVEHLKITDEAYTLDMGTNATQTFGFRSTNDLYVVKGDVGLNNIQAGIRRNIA